MSKKGIEHYRSLPYKRRVELRTNSAGEVYFVAWIAEIPALRIDGETREEALGKLNECLDDFLEMMWENNDEIPEPARWPSEVGVPLDQRPPAHSERGLGEDKSVDSETDQEEWSSDRPEPTFV